MTESTPLTPDHAAALLLASMQTLRAEVEALGPEAKRWHPAEGEWCVNKVIGHLLAAEEPSFRDRIERIIEQPGCVLVSWDQAQVAKDRHDCERSGAELIAELVEERERSVRLLRGLSDDQLALSGVHQQVGELRVIDLLHDWPHHDREHVKQALSITQAYVAEHMGNAKLLE
ncbi:MAG: DinB family protein [Chloroflexi bacterium]|nr:DinB family protein [Chloroflexota bacterium]